jgi:hypothetical protein
MEMADRLAELRGKNQQAARVAATLQKMVPSFQPEPPV